VSHHQSSISNSRKDDEDDDNADDNDTADEEDDADETGKTGLRFKRKSRIAFVDSVRR
jgi:hypothetical protein